MSKKLGVGIIGASAERGWAKDAHVPAVHGLDGLELVAVAAGDTAKANAAAKAFGATRGYATGSGPHSRDSAVDIVAVAVKVPDHRELVLAAVAAGKHVYCEWPLGRNLSETEEMAKTADDCEHSCRDRLADAGPSRSAASPQSSAGWPHRTPAHGSHHLKHRCLRA